MTPDTAARIRLVGNALIDLVMDLPRWPREDDELRAEGCERRAGGNAANSALRLAEAGHQVQLVCALAEDADGRWLRRRLERAGVDLSLARRFADGQTPLSSVWRLPSRATRCIVHYRNLPELPASALTALNPADADWLHLEGRNVEALDALLRKTGSGNPRCSLELEKPRPGLEALLQRVGWAIVSADYLRHAGERVEDFIARVRQQAPQLRLVCTQGVEGTWLSLPGAAPRHLPPPRRARSGDSLGAGDAFIAGLVSALSCGRSADEAVGQGQRWAVQKIVGRTP